MSAMKESSSIKEIPVGRVFIQETITVTSNEPRELVGGCNACTTRDYENVTVVDLRGMSIRLCSFCQKALKKAL